MEVRWLVIIEDRQSFVAQDQGYIVVWDLETLAQQMACVYLPHLAAERQKPCHLTRPCCLSLCVHLV